MLVCDIPLPSKTERRDEWPVFFKKITQSNVIN